jgi:hypothetical protein
MIQMLNIVVARTKNLVNTMSITLYTKNSYTVEKACEHSKFNSLINRLYRHTDKTMQKIDKQSWLNTVNI